MIKIIEKDVNYAFDVTKEAKSNKNKLSFSSNDRIDLISKNIDVSGKRILTILDSSDSVFCFYFNGAKKIDVYDSNKLAFYYFYLRIWTFIYLNQSYPPRSLNYEFLINLMKKVKPKSEDECNAYNFWIMFINKAKNDKQVGKLLFTKKSKLIDFSQYNLRDIALKVDDTSYFKGNVRDFNGNDKLYDIIYVSDKCDYIDCSSSSCDKEVIRVCNLKKYRDNLYRLLKDDGVVVCSFSNQQPEKIIFEERFDYFELSKAKDKGGNLVNCGYCYKKK